MSTVRSYFQDPYRRQFSAQVVSIRPLTSEEGWDVILTHTFFYPTSGGQPHDTGVLAGLKVVDVFIDGAQEDIVHRLAGPQLDAIVGQSIIGIIDWERRFDHMQHHTGQHILSQAFIEAGEAETVGFHLGEESCTIDLAVKTIEPPFLAAAETLANTVVFENRPIRAYFVTQVEADELPLRKRPAVPGDRLRLVDISEFDLNACGGTHVGSTGEVGLIKITRLEKRKDKVRVEFRCGRWALTHFDRLQRVATELSNEFTTSLDALPAAMVKLRQERKAIKKELQTVQKELLADRAARLARSFAHADDHEVAILVRCVDSSVDVEALTQLAGELAAAPNRAVLLGHPDGRFVLRKAANVSGHFGHLLQAALNKEPLSSGGGGPHFAQGALAEASGGRLLAFLTEIEAQLTVQLKEQSAME